MEDPPYVLEVEPLDLGADVKAVGLELVEMESREPARGADAARVWAAALGGLAGTEPWALDFFSHLDRVREYCRVRSVPFEEKASGRALVISTPSGGSSCRSFRTIRGRDLRCSCRGAAGCWRPRG